MSYKRPVSFNYPAGAYQDANGNYLTTIEVMRVLNAHLPEELTMQQSALSAGASVIQRAINADPKEWGGATALADAVYKAMRADLMRYLPSPQKTTKDQS